jgi:hypothetical protein
MRYTSEISGDGHSLEIVLQHIVELAVEITDARHGASFEDPPSLGAALPSLGGQARASCRR